MLVCNNNKFLLSPKPILFLLVRGWVKTQTAGVNPPKKVRSEELGVRSCIISGIKKAPLKGELDFCFSKKTEGSVLNTASTDFIHSEELLEEVDEFEEESLESCCVTIAIAIFF